MPFKINTNTVFPIIIPDASETAAGVMSAADKVKLDGLTPGGGMQWHVTNIQSGGDTYNAAANDFVPCDATGGNVGVVLPTAVGIAGQMVGVKDYGGGNASGGIKITTVDGQTIDSQDPATGIALSSYGGDNANYIAVVYMSDGDNWLVVYIYSGRVSG